MRVMDKDTLMRRIIRMDKLQKVLFVIAGICGLLSLCSFGVAFYAFFRAGLL